MEKIKKGREQLNALISTFAVSALEKPMIGQSFETFQNLRKKLGLN